MILNKHNCQFCGHSLKQYNECDCEYKSIFSNYGLYSYIDFFTKEYRFTVEYYSPGSVYKIAFKPKHDKFFRYLIIKQITTTVEEFMPIFNKYKDLAINDKLDDHLKKLTILL